MTEFLLISDIDVSNRQRKIFDDLAVLDLANGIKTNELLHAPVLLGDSPVLIAGERRLRAMALLHRKGEQFSYLGEPVPKDLAPVVRAAGRDLLALKEAELSENLDRQNLTWQERAAAEAELHDLRGQQKGKAQTLKETARELKSEGEPHNQDVTRLSENILLAKHLDDPSIAKVKDRKAALRQVFQKEQSQKRAEVAESLKLQAQAASPHTAIHGDMTAELIRYHGEKFDLLLTDPPYGVDASGFHDQFTIAHNYQDSSSSWPSLMKSLAELSFAQTKDEAHAFVFCDIRKWADLAQIFSIEGWDVWTRPLIWDKGALGALSKPGYGPRFCYEAILFATKGKKKVLKAGRDVITIPTGAKTRHGAEKPKDLYFELIDRTASAGSLLLDPFAGSGTIFPAATSAGCRAVGIELEAEYYHICLERIND